MLFAEVVDDSRPAVDADLAVGQAKRAPWLRASGPGISTTLGRGELAGAHEWDCSFIDHDFTAHAEPSVEGERALAWSRRSLSGHELRGRAEQAHAADRASRGSRWARLASRVKACSQAATAMEPASDSITSSRSMRN